MKHPGLAVYCQADDVTEIAVSNIEPAIWTSHSGLDVEFANSPSGYNVRSSSSSTGVKSMFVEGLWYHSVRSQQKALKPFPPGRV